MAQDTVGTLFNLPTAAQAGQQYLDGMMSSPGQMNQLSLLQQITAMGRDAGSMAGYGAGRLLGGKAPDEIRIQGVNEAMAEATQMGGTDAEMYANLAKGLATRGLTQDAMAATEKARGAKRDEQAMTLAASQEGRSVEEAKLRASEEQRRVLAAQQADAESKQRMALYPLDIQEKELAIRKREQDLNGPIGEVTLAQEALAKGIDPQTGEPLTAERERALRARLAQATMVINNEAANLAREKEIHELKKREIESKITENQAQTASANTNRGMSAFKQKATIQVPGFTAMDKFETRDVGWMNGYGQVQGKNGLFYANVNEAARAQGFIGGDAPAAAAANPAAPAANPAAPAANPAAPKTKPDPKSFFRSTEPAAYTDPMGF